MIILLGTRKSRCFTHCLSQYSVNIILRAVVCHLNVFNFMANIHVTTFWNIIQFWLVAVIHRLLTCKVTIFGRCLFQTCTDSVVVFLRLSVFFFGGGDQLGTNIPILQHCPCCFNSTGDNFTV